MAEIILFGGTSEGRVIAEALHKKGADFLVCAATGYGEALLPDNIRVSAKRLSLPDIEQLFTKECPRVVIDATHPYAAKISGHIRAACGDTRYIRVKREASQPGELDGCFTFNSIPPLIEWLKTQDGIIFSTLGAKEAGSFAGFKERMWLRILPDAGSLAACLNAGFSPKQIICMQGAFNRGLNTAMFRHAGANILLTKESGTEGGFAEKIKAANECGMTTAVLLRPYEEKGILLPEVLNRIIEDSML